MRKALLAEFFGLGINWILEMSSINDEIMDYTGLLFDCPLKEQACNCGFGEVRQLDLKERFEFWKRLSENDRNNLVSRHHICIYEREQTGFKTEKFSPIEKGLN
ncbi:MULTISPECIES: hypothetical protein [unclassified Saccharicrinis]|uniref:hypothetical protein n=1 Tax=unclassified Saccharicrinis TaxID=2646859 RepID=UPI003D357A9B